MARSARQGCRSGARVKPHSCLTFPATGDAGAALALGWADSRVPPNLFNGMQVRSASRACISSGLRAEYSLLPARTLRPCTQDGPCSQALVTLASVGEVGIKWTPIRTTTTDPLYRTVPMTL